MCSVGRSHQYFFLFKRRANLGAETGGRAATRAGWALEPARVESSFRRLFPGQGNSDDQGPLFYGERRARISTGGDREPYAGPALLARRGRGWQTVEGLDPRGRNDKWVTVVAAVGDTRSYGLERQAISQIYEVGSQRHENTRTWWCARHLIRRGWLPRCAPAGA